jgi:hypothetical protein
MKQIGLEEWLNQQSTCFASIKPEIQMLVPQKTKRERSTFIYGEFNDRQAL